ncbi:hypothetical protein EUX57_02065 [Pseudomonas orientalis]|uniref:Uncharacterized protein n=1 Tax=Pseudomonas orientalis TaxID=76758 RepID=A0A4V2DYC2_9PSED|nr:hypothetical protein EUX57_02065 [Pseudomonas orientalis]
MSDRVQKTPKTATDIFCSANKQGQGRGALTYKKHKDFLQVKMLIQTFHALGRHPGMGAE